jgi:DNA-binding NarL/FixJ family response regulator
MLGQEGTDMPVRVLVCEEIPIVRDGLRTLLEAEPDIDVVGATDSGNHAMILIRTQRPDVVVSGLSLRGLSPLEMIKRLVKEPIDPRPRFVVLIMDESDETVDTILHAQVHGLLAKDVTREELSSAIRAAARGQTTLAPPIAQRLVEWFRTHDIEQNRELQPVVAELTPRERQVLILAAHGLSAEEIAAELIIGLATARTHLYRLRCKLQLRDRAQLVSFAYRAGMMLPA